MNDQIRALSFLDKDYNMDSEVALDKHEFLKPPNANKPLFLQWEGVLAMGTGFMFHGFIVNATGRGF